MTNFTKVFDDNFVSDTSLKTNLWPIHWGNADDFSFQNGALTLTSFKSEGWKNVGFMQADFGASSGTGYGLYSATASANAGEGIGIAILLWPSSNAWPGPELDLLESKDSTRQSGYATIHWKGTDGSDQQSWHQFSIDLTKPHTYALDWEPTSLTYYIDGRQIFTTTSHVPKDYADGGQNESFGAEVTAAGSNPVSSSVSLHLYDMSYSKSAADPTITDVTGHAASLPVISYGNQIFSTASTGLAAPVTESVSGGVVTVSTPTGGLDKAIELSDAAGGSYQVQNFLDVNADLSGAANGSLIVNGAERASITLGDGNYSMRIQNDSSVVSHLTWNDVSFSGRTSTINFGTGNADVWGGKEADTFVFHAGDGLATIETFSALKGDVLEIDHTLKGAMTQTSTSSGTLISFGDPNHGVLLHGVTNLTPSSIDWI